MKPLTVFLVLGLTFQHLGTMAQEGRVGSRMELKYAMARIRPGNSPEAIAGATAPPRSSNIRNLCGPFTFPAFDPDSGQPRSCLSPGLSLQECAKADEQLVRYERLGEKFSFSQLAGGSIYDFRSRKNHRLEVGGNWELTNIKYEEPFCMTLFIRRRL